MNIKNKTFLAIFSIFFIIGCSNSSTETNKDSASGPIYMGPFYNEFIACTPGDNYSDENAREMLGAWKELDHSPDLLWACLLYTSPSPRDRTRSRMPSSA